MREHSRSNSTYDADKINTVIEDGFGKLDMLEYGMLLDDLKTLEDLCKDDHKKDFFEYFQFSIISAFCRFARTKKKAWPEKKDGIMSLCQALIPVFSAGILAAAAAIASSWASNQVVLPGNGMRTIVWIAGGCFVIASWLAMYLYVARGDKRNYVETWSRHSLCYSRLRLVMSEFLVSAKDDDAYQKLVDNTFAVLHQNLDQFAVNMCPNGMAPREQSGSKEKEKKEGK